MPYDKLYLFAGTVTPSVVLFWREMYGKDLVLTSRDRAQAILLSGYPFPITTIPEYLVNMPVVWVHTAAGRVSQYSSLVDLVGIREGDKGGDSYVWDAG